MLDFVEVGEAGVAVSDFDHRQERLKTILEYGGGRTAVPPLA